MSNRQIKIDGIPITLRKSKKAKKLILAVKPFKGVVLSIPYKTSFDRGINFAIENINWIKQQSEKIHLLESEMPVFDENSGLVTRNHYLHLYQWENDNIVVRVTREKINVKFPINMPSSSKFVQNAVKSGIERAYREEAKEYLPKRLNDLSDKYKLPFNEVYLKNIKSRWGSCSAKQNINLSIHLMKLPDHLIDYILLHELVHTVVKNHSSGYWKFLESILPNAKLLDKELRKFSQAVI